MIFDNSDEEEVEEANDEDDDNNDEDDDDNDEDDDDNDEDDDHPHQYSSPSSPPFDRTRHDRFSPHTLRA